MKIKFLVLCTMIVVLSSCNKDDDNAAENNSIIGNWKAVSLITAEPFDFNGDGVESNDLFVELECFESTTTFSSDGTQTSRTSDLTLEEQGDDFVFACDGSSSYSGTYMLEENTLTTTDEDGEVVQTATIEGNRLIIEGDDENFDEVTITFERQ